MILGKLGRLLLSRFFHIQSLYAISVIYLLIKAKTFHASILECALYHLHKCSPILIQNNINMYQKRRPFSECIRAYLDFGKIGAEYYADHGDAYIYCGYVLSKDSADQALLDFTQPHPAQELGGMNMA